MFSHVLDSWYVTNVRLYTLHDKFGIKYIYYHYYVTTQTPFTLTPKVPSTICGIKDILDRSHRWNILNFFLWRHLLASNFCTYIIHFKPLNCKEKFIIMCHCISPSWLTFIPPIGTSAFCNSNCIIHCYITIGSYMF